MSTKSIYILILILLLALFLRSKDIESNPPELFSDEIVNFVSARSVIERGYDLEGNLMPYFSDRVEPRPPVYGYFSYLFTRVVGESAAGIRSAAIFFGIVSIILVYLLTLEFFKDSDSALFAAFFMAIIPWHIHYSRAGWEPASLLPFLLLSTYLFIYGVNRNKKLIIASSFGFFALTVYTYQAAPLYSFLFLASLLILYRNYFFKEWRVLLFGAMIAAFLLIPYVWSVFNVPHFYRRAGWIFTFANGFNAETVNVFLSNYFSHFSPAFLFIDGDPNIRHGAQTGTLYWAMLPFLFAGVVYLLTSKPDKKVLIFIIFWIVVFPLAGALTNDGVPHATRSLPGAPVMCVLSGYGVSGLIRSLSGMAGGRKAAYALYAAVIVLSLVSLSIFSKRYFYLYPKISYPAWEYGQKDIFTEIRKIEGDYKRVCLESMEYLHEKPLLDYYARDSKLDFTTDMKLNKCTRRGTIRVQTSNKRKNELFRLIKIIKAPNVESIFYIFGSPVRSNT